MLRRCFEILGLLSERPRTLEHLAHECGVHQRTIRRDLAALKACGLDITRLESGHWRLANAIRWEMRP